MIKISSILWRGFDKGFYGTRVFKSNLLEFFIKCYIVVRVNFSIILLVINIIICDKVVSLMHIRFRENKKIKNIHQRSIYLIRILNYL